MIKPETRSHLDLGPRRHSRVLIAAIVVGSLGLVFALDASTGAAPFQHLYYIPIVVAGLGLFRYAGPTVGLIAVILYHLANPALVTSRYRESDVVQIALFLATGLVTDKLADDHQRLRRLAVTDDLTGLYNLRGFEARLDRTVRTSRQTATPLSLLVLDVDRLKSLNDTHGHLAGADAVWTVGQLVAAHLPEASFACRFGGDEFVVALPGQGVREAGETANTLQKAVNATAPTLAGIAFPAGTLSISIGLACQANSNEPGSDASAAGVVRAGEALFHAADQALYLAKAAGRNRVKVAGRAEDSATA